MATAIREILDRHRHHARHHQLWVCLKLLRGHSHFIHAIQLILVEKITIILLARESLLQAANDVSLLGYLANQALVLVIGEHLAHVLRREADSPNFLFFQMNDWVRTALTLP